MMNELKNISLIDNVAKTFCDEWKLLCVAGFTAPQLDTSEVTERAEPPIPEKRLSLAERKVQWIICASLEMQKDRASGKLSHGK